MAKEDPERDVFINERGQFWLQSANLKEPGPKTFGCLTIDERGNTYIDLDHVDSTWEPFTYPAEQRPRLTVFGFLFSKKRAVRCDKAYVVLHSPVRGGWLPERVGSFTCIVSVHSVSLDGSAFPIRRFSIPLGNRRAWLNRPIAKLELGESQVTVQHSLVVEDEYQIKAGTMSILSATGWGRDFSKSEVTITEQSHIVVRPNTPIDAQSAVTLSAHIKDLVTLLCDQDSPDDTLAVELLDSDYDAQLFFVKRNITARDFTTFNGWVAFSQVKTEFGAMVDRWQEIRDSLGSAIFLYLGYRRGGNFYVELQFISLISGMESLHLQAYPQITNPKIEKKIARVLSALSSDLSPRDRDWAKEAMELRLKPSLGDRLMQLIDRLPVRFEPRSLERFTQRCNTARNNISHFGGSAPGTDRQTFIADVGKLVRALDHLYHATLLAEVGVDRERIKEVFGSIYRSAVIRSDQT